MNKVIEVSLSEKGVSEAIKELQEYRTWFDKKCLEFRKKVAEEVATQLRILLASAWHNDFTLGGKEPVYIPVKVIETEKASIVVADSPDAVFVEFGAGIYYNGGPGMVFKSPHPRGLELGLTIGSYPDGGPSQGTQEQWYVPNKGETSGTEAQKPLWLAMQYTRPHIASIARLVFGTD